MGSTLSGALPATVPPDVGSGAQRDSAVQRIRPQAHPNSQGCMILARTRGGRNRIPAHPVGKSTWRKSVLFDDSPAADPMAPPTSRFAAATSAAAVALR